MFTKTSDAVTSPTVIDRKGSTPKSATGQKSSRLPGDDGSSSRREPSPARK